jgi:hypothetical protein
MPPDVRSNANARISENISGCVTILQWFKHVDPTLGLSGSSVLHDTQWTGKLPKWTEAKTNQVINSLGWVGPLASHLRGIRLGLVPARGLT